MGRKNTLHKISIIVIIIVFIVIALGIINIFINKNNDRIIEKLDNAEIMFNNDINDNELKNLLSELHQSKLKYAKNKSLFLSAKLSEDNDAILYYNEIRSDKNSYLYPIASINAAYLSEKNGKVDDALSIFKELSENKSYNYFAEATFNIARIYETMNDSEEAIKYYNLLINHLEEESIWKIMAINHLIGIGK